MPSTPVYGFPYPDNTYAPDPPQDIENLAAAVESTLQQVTAPLSTSWRAYTPTWTGSGTAQPAYGNATLNCSYKQLNNVVFYRISIVFGSTTSFGTGGQYSFGLPVTCTAPAVGGMGTGIVNNGGAYKPIIAYLTGATTVNIIRVSTEGVLGPQGAGSVWAAGDQITIGGTYQAASS